MRVAGQRPEERRQNSAQRQQTQNKANYGLQDHQEVQRQQTETLLQKPKCDAEIDLNPPPPPTRSCLGLAGGGTGQ
jgi:hypothetical protein